MKKQSSRESADSTRYPTVLTVKLVLSPWGIQAGRQTQTGRQTDTKSGSQAGRQYSGSQKQTGMLFTPETSPQRTKCAFNVPRHFCTEVFSIGMIFLKYNRHFVIEKSNRQQQCQHFKQHLQSLGQLQSQEGWGQEGGAGGLCPQAEGQL